MSVLVDRRRLRALEGRLRARIWGAGRGVTVGRRVHVGRGCRLILERGARLELGDGCTIDDQTTIAVYGAGRIALGPGVFVGSHATLAAHESVVVGAGTFLAELVSVRDHDHEVGVPPRLGRRTIAPVSIGEDSWLGSKVTVVRGARVGDRVVVGANAVVRGELPSDVVAAGLPARVVRRLEG